MDRMPLRRPRAEELRRQVKAARTESADRTSVAYDLTGIDFSRPRHTAEAVAEVVWNEDVQRWWSMRREKATIEPDTTVVLTFPRMDGWRYDEAVASFKVSLEDRANKLVWFLNDHGHPNLEWDEILRMGAGTAYLLDTAGIHQERRHELEDILPVLWGHIRIRTP